MPRLPTIRVMGSQFISTRFPFCSGFLPFDSVKTAGINPPLFRSGINGFVTSALVVAVATPVAVMLRFVTRGQFRAGMPPFRFFVDHSVGDGSQRTNQFSIRTD